MWKSFQPRAFHATKSSSISSKNRWIGDPSSFTNLHNVEEEEKLIAQAIEQKKSREDFDAELEAQHKKENTLLLTSDPHRMMDALEEARREEEAWPTHHYLWAVHPIVDWVKDRMRDVFGRHTAPVLLVGANPPHHPQWSKHDLAIIVSGLLPDHHGRPLVHRWYVALFKKGRLHDRGKDPFCPSHRRPRLQPLTQTSEAIKKMKPF